MKKGGGDDQWKVCPDRRKKSFVLSNLEYKVVVKELSLRVRAEEEEKLTSIEEAARRKPCRAMATEVAAQLSRMAEGNLSAD